MECCDFPALHPLMSIFCPANSRGIARFQSLKAVKLTGEQKDFFASQCCDEIGDNPDIKIPSFISSRDLKKRYEIPEGTANGWIKNFKNKIRNPDGMGAPKVLDKTAIKDHFDALKEGKAVYTKRGVLKSKKALFTNHEVKQSLQFQHRMTLQRRGIVIDVDDEDDQHHIKSATTIRKMQKVRFFAMFFLIHSRS